MLFTNPPSSIVWSICVKGNLFCLNRKRQANKLKIRYICLPLASLQMSILCMLLSNVT